MAITEAQTRAELIDAQLGASGWNVKDPTQVVEEFDILTSLPDGVAEPRTKYEGHQFSDYVLLGKDRKPLAVVEAKKSSRDAAIGRDLEDLYGAFSQQAFKDELDLTRVPLQKESAA
jgi:type I restriction enzyme R subunit